MAVAPADIAEGKCYRTNAGHVRHVTRISRHQVSFETRGKKHRKFPWDRQPDQSKAKFVSDVVDEVPCHWDPYFTPPAGPTV